MARFSISPFSRLGVVTLALIYTSLTFGAALSPSPAFAAASAPYYTAELAAPAKDARTVAGGVAWYCEGTRCVAAKGDSRPERICRTLVRDQGAVTSFAAKGEALAEDKLAACNGK